MEYGLYVITDEEVRPGISHIRIAREALKGGADVIQLREKKRSSRELLEIAKEIKVLSKEHGALFIVNDRLDIALASEADGAHLGQDDLPLKSARKLAPSPFILGISVGSVEEAIIAEKEGADYIGVGPVFHTTTKPDAGCFLGTKIVSEICSAVSLPVIAIGGIGINNFREVIQAGASGVAVISAIVCAPDICKESHRFKCAINLAKKDNS